MWRQPFPGERGGAVLNLPGRHSARASSSNGRAWGCMIPMCRFDSCLAHWLVGCPTGSRGADRPTSHTYILPDMDLRYILSWVLPMPMATTYRAVDADGHDLGMETCRWWQWAGRAYRIRTSET